MYYVCGFIDVCCLRKIFCVCHLVLLRSAEKYPKKCCLFAKIYCYLSSCKALVVLSHHGHSHLTSLCICFVILLSITNCRVWLWGGFQSHDVYTTFCENLSADSRRYRQTDRQTCCVLVSLMSLGKGSRENGECMSCDVLGIM